MGTLELTAPSSWASYLINGDASGISVEEKQMIDVWIQGIRAKYPKLEIIGPVSCEDAGFRKEYSAKYLTDVWADCQLYTFHTQKKKIYKA